MILVDFSQTIIANLMVEFGNNLGEIRKDLMRHMIVNSLRSYKIKFQKYGEMVIACDSGQYWRREFFSPYKHSRKKQREVSNIDWDTVFEVMTEMRYDIEEYFPYKILRINGAEADDIIAVLIEWLQENQLEKVGLFEEPQPVMIISGDKDFVQLQKFSNVKQFSPRFKKLLKPQGKIENVLLEHIIRGDSGDGVPNILSADDVFIKGERQKPLRTEKVDGWIKDINTLPTALRRNFDRNKTLIDLSEIPSELKTNIVDAYVNSPNKDRSKLIEYFMQHEMKHMLDCVSQF